MSAQSSIERVTIVTVTYNSSAVMTEMLASLPDQTPVVVVDNASDDVAPIREIVSTCGKNAHLIESDKNEGFGAGCNRGARAARTEFLLFLNPDTTLFSDALQKLVRAADHCPEVSGFNPRILDENDRPILKRRSDLVPRRNWLPPGDLLEDRLVPVLSGAALFVRRDDFETVGGFDDKIFLFFEDDDLSVRLSGSCGDLKYVHEAKVRHIGGASTEWSAHSEAFKNWHWGFSQIYAMRKHHIGNAGINAFLKTGLRAVSPLTALSRKRRQKYHSRLSGMLASARRRHSENEL